MTTYLGTRTGYVYHMLMIFRTRIIAEAHGSKYSIYPVSTKMYHEHKYIYLWDDIKKEIEEYVAKILIVNML